MERTLPDFGEGSGHQEFPTEIAETHSAIVFLVGDRAYKWKKPVRLDFLDFSTREAREAACHREVELNRRLAPDVYLGVADVYGPDGRPADHLVVMRRLPGGRRLSRLIADGQDVTEALTQIARLVASFHSRSSELTRLDPEKSSAVARAASIDAQSARWKSNLDEFAPYAGRLVDADLLDDVRSLADRYLAGRRRLFEKRIREGRACDGHGDLLADDIFCMDDGPRVLDCLDFDDSLRYGDSLADVAFLAMDLERLGRIDLAVEFLDRYREFSGDNWPASLAHHYVAYRATVRSKVECVRASQGGVDASPQAVRLAEMALAHLRKGRVRLVLVGGRPGSGKSTVAEGLAARTGMVLLDSDRLRKDLAGLPHDVDARDAFGKGIYSEELTVATYEALVERAEDLLHLGESVVIDATWKSSRDRKAASAAAARASADLVELRCSAPLEVEMERIARRRTGASVVSDATPEVAEAIAAEEEDWPTAVELDTTVSPDEVVKSALAVLQGDDGR